MKILIPQRTRLAGFSLVEMAIVLLITGILMSAGLSLLTLKMEAAYQDATRKNQEVIKQALINYLGKNRRLPCPAYDASGKEDRNISATTPPCNRYSGIVPYSELGLDRSIALDGWENFISYVVTPISIAAALPSATPSYTVEWLYSFKYGSTQTNSITPISSTAFWPSTSTGGIKVTDGGATTIADPALATGAVVALISYGKNGYGAINIKNTQNDFSAAGTDEKQNADATKLVSGTPPTVLVIKRDATDATAGGGAFDDIVMILNAYDLTGPLVTNGTLLLNAQTALSQANDIVMGSIAASKSCSPCSYIIPASSSITFPSTITAWGITYAPSILTMDISTIGATPAYVLTAGDGTTKIVSKTELNGNLGKIAGFLP
jgi:prepilin-type N-terminal cleavage/methylation domain-containing protein